jgi:predicted ATP-dependent endonuclease of OLD family
MLKHLHLQNFTVFADAKFEFGPGLNVLVGTNGTGKSHVLKLGYIALASVSELLSDIFLTKDARNWQLTFNEYLMQVLRPENLGKLVRRGSIENIARVQAEMQIGQDELKIEFSFSPDTQFLKNEERVKAIQFPREEDDFAGGAVFIPAKEILSLYPGLKSLYEKFDLALEKTVADLCDSLSLPLLRMPEKAAKAAIKTLEKLMQGEIRLESGRFYIYPQVGERLEIDLAAEGIRKIATLAQLLANNGLRPEITLFWDEPEANLNPALLRELAAILAELSRQGFQIILATHSTDLLKEFHILSRQKNAQPLPIKYFGLNAEPGEATRIVSTDNFEYLPDVVALAEELKQADELEEIFIRDDREYYANNRGEE